MASWQDNDPLGGEPRRLVFAVGDVHGRYDLLLQAAEAIRACARGHSVRTVMLGDYVDRGPQSREVVAFLMRDDCLPGLICLKGNHEEMMVEALRRGDTSSRTQWTRNGGDETLISYGGLAGAPDDHLAWLESLPLLTTDDHRIYVHAGVTPGLDLQDNDPHTCLWIRQRFLKAPASELPAHVVHGHTPRWEGKPDDHLPELLPHRTNLDTGAYYTGVLTVGVFDQDLAGGPVAVITVTELGWRCEAVGAA